MTVAAVAAGALADNPERVPNVTENTAVNPVDGSRPITRRNTLTNKRG